MKLIKSFGQSTLERYMNKKAGKETETKQPEAKTFIEERQEAERKAVEHDMKRQAQKEKFANGTPHEFAGYHKDDVTDHDRVVAGAFKTLKAHIDKLIGKGGYDMDVDEFRSRKSHRDIADDSEVTEQALISFDVKFALAAHKKHKTAKFVVSFKAEADEQYSVENSFYDSNESEYALTSSNLENFLSAEQNMNEETKEQPLAFYNVEFDGYEVVDTAEPTDKVVARLRSNGFKVEREWIDACYDPKQFGRLCYVAQVPLGQDKEFKKMASMSDDDWTSRSHEKSWKHKDQEWNDRALEKEGDYGKMPLDKDETWFNRADEKKGSGNYGDPYAGGKALYVDSNKKEDRKEAVKKVLEARQKTEKETTSALEQLENLMKND